MNNQNLIFSGHAVKQMFKLQISRSDVKAAISKGEIIAEYLDDKPYPSVLLLAFVKERPLHVVVAKDLETNSVYVITAYEPDIKIWNAELKKRRRE